MIPTYGQPPCRFYIEDGVSYGLTGETTLPSCFTSSRWVSARTSAR